MNDPTNKGLIDETRDLYKQLSERSKTPADRELKETRRRSPAIKALFVACLVAAFLAGGTLAYGALSFPDGPIRAIASGYVGKHGAAHTRDEYEEYKLWEKVVMASFGLALVLGFGAVAIEKMAQRKKKTPI